jgi:hypothetical protein
LAVLDLSLGLEIYLCHDEMENHKERVMRDPSKTIMRCQEIQTTLGSYEVPDFEAIPELGMATRLALHIRGLPIIKYETLKLVATHFLNIPKLAVERVVRLLAEVEFVRLKQTGSSITGVLPTVPYYDELYKNLGAFAASERRFNEAEELTLELVERLAKSPEKVDSLRSKLGADKVLFDRSITVGTTGSYLVKRRFRGRDVLINPTYFSENSEIFADAVAATGASGIRQLLDAVSESQGWPLGLIEKRACLGTHAIKPDQLQLLKRLAQDGIVKPPTIETTYSGKNHFIFTPTPSAGVLSPGKREIYERAMAIVSAIRQGQLLPRRYAIRSPGAVLYTLRSNLRLGKATTEATQQYKQLTVLRIARLIDVGNGYSELEIIDTPENREALDIAYELVTEGKGSGMEVDDTARKALQESQEYVESLIASADMRKREKVQLSEEQAEQLDLLFMEGIST